MKISAQEEYGLRCTLQLARAGTDGSLTIRRSPSGGALLRLCGQAAAALRRAELVESERGRSGGYRLAVIPDRSPWPRCSGPWDTSPGSGGCSRFPGSNGVCVHAAVCSIRALWCALDTVVDDLLRRVSLADLQAGRGFQIPLQPLARSALAET